MIRAATPRGTITLFRTLGCRALWTAHRDEHLEILCDRLEQAVMNGLLPISLNFYRRILAALFPEDFELPEGPIDAAPFFPAK